jgi:DNA-directed RNA polymerase alpha subunit
LQFSTRAFDVLKANNLDTVMDILECGWHQIGLFRHAGPRMVNEIKNKIDNIVLRKNKVRELTGTALARAVEVK